MMRCAAWSAPDQLGSAVSKVCEHHEFSQEDVRLALLELVDTGELLMSVDASGDPADGTFITFWFADEESENHSDEAVAVG